MIQHIFDNHPTQTLTLCLSNYLGFTSLAYMTIANGLSAVTIASGGTLNRASINDIPLSERLVVGRTQGFIILPILI